MTQTLVDISKIVEPNARTAADFIGQTLFNAGMNADGSTTGVTTATVAAAGRVGEQIGGQIFGTATTATVTITIAAPGVITWTAHGFSTVLPQPVVFTTTLALPTGITAGTVYYTVPSSITTNTFTIATSVANALAGTAITTSGSQSGTQTGTAGAALANNTILDVTGANFTAGDWDIWASVYWNTAASTTWTKKEASLNTTSATLATPPAVSGSTYAILAQISAAATNGVQSMDIGPMVLNVNTTTTVWLSVKSGFAISTDGAYGFLMGRRRR